MSIVKIKIVPIYENDGMVYQKDVIRILLRYNFVYYGGCGNGGYDCGNKQKDKSVLVTSFDNNDYFIMYEENANFSNGTKWHKFINGIFKSYPIKFVVTSKPV
jgi:hypothetical protein